MVDAFCVDVESFVTYVTYVSKTLPLRQPSPELVSVGAGPGFWPKGDGKFSIIQPRITSTRPNKNRDPLDLLHIFLLAGFMGIPLHDERQWQWEMWSREILLLRSKVTIQYVDITEDGFRLHSQGAEGDYELVDAADDHFVPRHGDVEYRTLAELDLSENQLPFFSSSFTPNSWRCPKWVALQVGLPVVLLVVDNWVNEIERYWNDEIEAYEPSYLSWVTWGQHGFACCLCRNCETVSHNSRHSFHLISLGGEIDERINWLKCHKCHFLLEASGIARWSQQFGFGAWHLRIYLCTSFGFLSGSSTPTCLDLHGIYHLGCRSHWLCFLPGPSQKSGYVRLAGVFDIAMKMILQKPSRVNCPISRLPRLSWWFSFSSGGICICFLDEHLPGLGLDDCLPCHQWHRFGHRPTIAL